MCIRDSKLVSIVRLYCLDPPLKTDSLPQLLWIQLRNSTVHTIHLSLIKSLLESTHPRHGRHTRTRPTTLLCTQVISGHTWIASGRALRTVSFGCVMLFYRILYINKIITYGKLTKNVTRRKKRKIIETYVSKDKE